MHGYLLGLSTVRPRIRCKLIRGQPHLRPTIAPQQGEKYQQHQDGKASHVIAPPLIVCTVPGADQEGGSRALFIYPHSPRPATLCRQMPRVPGTLVLSGSLAPLNLYEYGFNGWKWILVSQKFVITKYKAIISTYFCKKTRCHSMGCHVLVKVIHFFSFSFC